MIFCSNEEENEKRGDGIGHQMSSTDIQISWETFARPIKPILCLCEVQRAIQLNSRINVMHNFEEKSSLEK